MSKYFMLQDQQKCIGCHACEIQCKSNKSLPTGPKLCQIIHVGPKFINKKPRASLFSCFVFIVKILGALLPALPAPCSEEKKMGSFLWIMIFVWDAKLVSLLAPGEHPNGIRKLGKWSNVTTAWTV